MCLLKVRIRPGDGAGLEGAEAGRCAVPGRAAGLHRPHQLLPGLHPGSHPGARGCLRHTPRTKVKHTLWPLFISLYQHLLGKPHSPLPLPPGFYQPSSWSSSARPARSSSLSFSSKSCRKFPSASRTVGCSTCQSSHRASWTTPCTALWFTRS